jgi:hypothetical protein
MKEKLRDSTRSREPSFIAFLCAASVPSVPLWFSVPQKIKPRCILQRGLTVPLARRAGSTWSEDPKVVESEAPAS